MKKIRTGDVKLIQELNRSIILNMIRERGPISRSEIAKSNNISPTTVASAVQELIREGFVQETGVGQSNGGRKPILLKFSPDNHFMICASISNSLIEVAKMNLARDIFEKQTLNVKETNGQQVLASTLEMIDRLVEASTNMDRCIGISVVTPGIVDRHTGVIHYNAKLGLAHMDLKSMMELRYGRKVWVENDTNAAVMAEKLTGKYGGVRNLLYITVGDGVGAGIIVNDTLLSGERGGAGEFGHTSVDRSGIRCECGNVGCLENYVSWPAVYGRIITSISRGRGTTMLSKASVTKGAITPSVFNEALNEGDALAVDVADEMTGYLGAGVVNLINLLNPEVIILGGELIFESSVLFDKIYAYVAKHALHVLSEKMHMYTSSLGQDAKLIGAASILMQDVFHFSLAR
ncbi:ROK family transcriptional regulator [Paenibacillus xerothermodurans]|uniref:ROK family transcriptional regulator n=1 Tax=Paenibacillus xerothermodurans TaxID=1977292 RepID=UPI001FB3FAE2|nr:ROK family transcriptional regulator [Paenibacillus xerothermodurans]